MGQENSILGQEKLILGNNKTNYAINEVFWGAGEFDIRTWHVKFLDKIMHFWSTVR
jgi:hypothetical protein